MESRQTNKRVPMAEAAAEDRLSVLHDDILHSILRDLPLKHAVRTSALSRRWAPQWLRALAASPVLDFTDWDFARGQPPARAAATVGRCLRLHAEHGAPLDALRLALVAPPPGPGDGGAFGRDVVGCVAAAVARGAREVEVELELDLDAYATPPRQEQDAADHAGSAALLELPGDLFQAGNSLERLALGRLSLRAVAAVGLPAAGLAGLRSLSLSHTDVTDAALRGVLAGCPELESLSLRCCALLTAVRVASERLRALEILGCRAVRELRVAAPALESLTLFGDVLLSTEASYYREFVDVDLGAAAPALRDVYLSQMEWGDFDYNWDYYYPFVYHVPQARILTLCSIGLVVPIDCYDDDDDDDQRFAHLPCAHVNGRDTTDIELPNLQELQLLLGSIQEEGDNFRRYPERVYYFFAHTSLPVLERLFIRLSSDPSEIVPPDECDDSVDDLEATFRRGCVLGQLTFMKVVNFRGTWRECRLVAYLLRKAPILEQLVLVTVQGDEELLVSIDEGDEKLEVSIEEWASELRKASREARISVCRHSEDDSPNHAHTRFFNEEFCCLRK